MIGRRGFITGLISLVAAPAIVRAGSLMPVKVMIDPVYGVGPMMDALPLMLHVSQIVAYKGRIYWITGKDNVLHRLSDVDVKLFAPDRDAAFAANQVS